MDTTKEPEAPLPRTMTVKWMAIISASIAAALALGTASQTYLSMLSHGHSFVRLFLWQLGCWGFWAAVAPWVVGLSARHKVAPLIALGLGLTLAHGVFAAELAVWIQPYVPFVSHDFTYAFASLWWFVVLIDPPVYCLLIVIGKALTTADRNKQLALSQSRLEAELARAQLEALRLEIQPHFLFNTLNAIAALIRVNDNPGALSMLFGLSDLMRATLDNPAGQTAPLGDELKLVAQYVGLQRARFGDRLEVTYQIAQACESCECPVFLLQPLVENALRHGLAPRSGKGRLRIAAELDDARLRLQIVDDGVGLRPGFDLGRDVGTGLRNTRSRLAHLYRDEARLNLLTNADGGTTVELVLPARRSRSNDVPASGAA